MKEEEWFPDGKARSYQFAICKRCYLMRKAKDNKYYLVEYDNLEHVAVRNGNINIDIICVLEWSKEI